MTTKKDDTFLKLFRSLSREDKDKLINQGKELKKTEVKERDEKKTTTLKKEIRGTSETEDRYVRVIFRFGSNGSKAHEPLYIQAVIDGLKEESDKLYDLLYNAVMKLYGEAVIDSGKFSIDHIPYPQYNNYEIRYKRSEFAQWKTWR